MDGSIRSALSANGGEEAVLPGLMSMHGAWRDVRVGARRLLQAPILLSISVVSLAFGVAVTTVLYSVLDTAFWRGLGIAEPDRVGAVTISFQGREHWLNVVAAEDFLELQGAQRTFASVTASAAYQDVFVAPPVSRVIGIEAVAPNYFTTLGVQIETGRPLHGPDAQDRTVVVSHQLWRRAFGGRPDISGQLARIGGELFVVVGVAPPAFVGLLRSGVRGTDAWIPMEAAARLPAAPNPNGPLTPDTGVRPLLSVLGRLAPGRTMEQARGDVAAVARALDATAPLPRRQGPEVATTGPARRWGVRSMSDPNPGAQEPRLAMLLMVLVALALWVAWTNLSSLMLARGVARRPEFAVKQALGASRGRLVRELLAETAVVAVLGMLVALALTRLALHLAALLPDVGWMVALHATPDTLAWPVAGVTLLVSVCVFGLGPALRVTRATARADLATGAGIAGDVQPRRQASLIRWQVAVCTGYLLLAVTLATVVTRATQHDSGIDLDELVMATVNARILGWEEGAMRRAMQGALEEATSSPAIEAAAIVSAMPFGINARLTGVSAGSAAHGGGIREIATVLSASPDVLRTLGIALVAGRGFDHRDDGSSPVIVISEWTARRLFGGASEAVGRDVVMDMAGPAGDPRSRDRVVPLTVIGVARDTDVTHLMRRNGALVYVPFAQQYESRMILVARHHGSASAAGAALRTALQRADPDLVAETIAPARDLLSGPYRTAWIAGISATGLASITAILVMIGLYGMLAQVVTSRTREIGVRLALGASMAQIKGIILREGYRPVVQGLAIGLLFGAFARVAVRAYLALSLGRMDLIAFTLVPVLLSAVVLVACYVPAARAARIDPNDVLRQA
jgi:putative ABC transport system permease protein